AGATNSGAVTIQVNAFSALNAYKDTAAGPVALSGAEIVQNGFYTATYDSTLNSNAGGFHVRGGSVINNTAINPSVLQIGGNSLTASLTRMLSTQATVGYTVIPANSTQEATIALANVAVNDLVIVGLPATVTAGLMFNQRVLATGSLGLRAANVTGSS